MNSEKRGVFGARKVRTPGFVDYSSSSGSTSSDDSTENALSGEKLDIKGILHQKNFYRLNLIFWIIMGCGIARFGRKGLKTTET